MEEKPTPILLKLVALGDWAVGKTSCIRRYTDNAFSEEYKSTIGTAFYVKTLDMESPSGRQLRVRAVIWDLAGQPTYNELRKRHMSGASIGLILFDITRPPTFMTVNEWFMKFIAVCPEASVALLANKVDTKRRLVPIEAGKMVAEWLEVKYFEVSAKTGKNIDEVFTDLVLHSSEVQDA
ncbi:MAG: GTP-binding protein [Candidatus Thorarchaeota archaeon]|jgi:small GTP-binding protein